MLRFPGRSYTDSLDLSYDGRITEHLKRVAAALDATDEGKAQLREGRCPLVAAMWHGPKVGDREMALATSRVRCRTDGRGVRSIGIRSRSTSNRIAFGLHDGRTQVAG